MTMTSFDQLPLSAAMHANLASLGYAEPTPIQAASLPPLLAGADLIAQAKTGSGKTAAFGIGLLERLEVERFAVQSLVLCPTRELADQVAKSLRQLARATHNVKILSLCGGVSIGPQLGSLEHGAHIIVGTPGRIGDHLRKGSLALDQLRLLVLDEADRMLEMGFADQLEAIVDATPRDRQTLLFSATFPEGIEALSQHIQRDPQRITVEAPNAESTITQWKFEISEPAGKPAAVAGLLHHYQPESTVVFCNTKRDCDALADYLRKEGFSAQALHGDLEQRERDQVLVRFANKSCLVLIATDVAARGLDIAGLDAVINVDVTPDPEVHTHRIGRTGRAGNAGLALSLYTPREAKRLTAIEEYQHGAIAEGPRAAPNASGTPRHAPMVTLDIDGGRKHKLRPGDIVGALTRDEALSPDEIGKIDVFDFAAYVAVANKSAKRALAQIQNGKIKGRKFRARILR
ncbi:ATP-dependent RNA helicase DbpA [Phytohalomonas tamaricis]|uniref:ATP-dependent RNA helicase DbpA n=1 Tax=Phytohalomonas tamaricis TaxID=2081032 RepID=UPI000D0AF4E3|nr:ATP-dependent RNA helicase DbpA [Phytohalomonas tamaricis]